MNRVASVFAIVLFFPAVSSEAREDKIELFTDPSMSSCFLTDREPFSFQYVYVLHNEAPGTRGSRFRVPTPACWTGATLISGIVAPGFLSIGAINIDMQVMYGACLFGSIQVATIQYFATGQGLVCCELEAVPSVDLSDIQVLDCLENVHEASSGSGVRINPDGSCSCDETPPPPPDLPDRGDRIELYVDAGGGVCQILDDSPGIRSIHMFHKGPLPAVASEFAVPKPDCWSGAVWMGDTIEPSFLSLGTSQTDLSVFYGECRQPPIYIGSINFYSTGQAASCCDLIPRVGVGANPSAILVVDCASELALGLPGNLVVINPDASCPCEQPVSVRETTWGRIKAMYRK